MANRPMINTYENNELVYRPMNDEEYALHVRDSSDRLNDVIELEKMALCNEVKARLQTTDVWVIRSFEDGVAMSTARKTYRTSLRTLLTTIADSDNLDSITIPDEPSYP